MVGLSTQCDWKLHLIYNQLCFYIFQASLLKPQAKLSSSSSSEENLSPAGVVLVESHGGSASSTQDGVDDDEVKSKLLSVTEGTVAGKKVTQHLSDMVL